MTASDGKGISIPWAPLLALVATVAGLSTLLPSRSARPAVAGTEVALGSKGVSARLWQDPVQVVQEAETRRKKETPPPTPKGWRDLREEFAALSTDGSPPLVLMMCVPDSPYAEDVERRLRDRAAMHFALSAEDYVPKRSTALNYVLTDTDPSKGYSLPFEPFIPLDSEEYLGNSATRRRPKVLVVWVGDGYLGSKPLEGMAQIVQQLLPVGACDLSPPQILIFGPSSSGQYRKVLEELKVSASCETKRLLCNAHVYSCKATGAEAELRKGIPWLGKGETTAGAIQKALRIDLEGMSHFTCERTLATDDQFCKTLLDELSQRHIGPTEHIVVLSELDSFYGRASTKSFIVTDSLAAGAVGAPFDHKLLHASNVHAYTYMAGIDGVLPKNALGIEEHPDKDQGSKASGPTPIEEPTEGQSQIDYFRRLADALVEKNHRLIIDGGSGFRAVAVLGSDIYDKLQILRTLRPRLPNALFLTNGLDARYGHPDEWDETRNLLAVASYPLSLDGQVQTPPFRDSTQTALYAAIRHSFDLMENRPGENWIGKPRLFEIGRHGPVELRTATPKAPPRWPFIPVANCALFLMSFLLLRHTVPKPATAPSDFLGHLCQWLSRGTIAVPAAVVLSAGITAWRCVTQNPENAEPFAFYDGISIWPGDFVRLLVFLLGIHFVCKTLIGLKDDSEKLAEEFGVESNMEKQKFWPHGDSRSTNRVDVHSLLNRYGYWTTPRRRAVRALILLGIYFVLILSITAAFPSVRPFLPVRGQAYLGSTLILYLAILSTLYVTFLVVDATTLNCMFIRDLNRARTNWDLSNERLAKTKFNYSKYLAVLEDDDCADYLDIQYIARRSNTVNRLVYFPFILIALMIAARWSQTDGYTWPTMLIVIFVMNASWAIYCAIRLPLEARTARDASLRRLRGRLFERRAKEAVVVDEPKKPESNSVALEAVIEQIEKLREGAFVGIWEQPLLRAILVPSGGVGLWALFDLLPR